MSRARARGEPVNLDLLALALLCCLLASVVGVLVLNDADRAVAHENRWRDPRIWSKLRQRVGHVAQRMKEVEDGRRGLVEKVMYAGLDRENRALAAQLTGLDQSLALREELDHVRAETARLTQEVASMEREAKANTSEMRRLLGDYKGRYVLIECVKDGAIVHPGGRRIGVEPSEGEREVLLRQIADAGFVAFVVRPDGWYMNSFDKLRAVLYRELDQREKGGAAPVGRSTFPLDRKVSIARYLPPAERS